MKNNKLDIFEQNAEFFERFNNSSEDTANDRHERTRFTVTGLENKVEFAVTNAAGRIKKAEDDAIANIVDTTQSVGTGKYLREGAYGVGGNVVIVSAEDDITKIRSGGLYRSFYNSGSFNYGHFLHMNYSSDFYSQVGVKSVSTNNPVWTFNHRIANGTIYSGNFHHTLNTRTDKNNVLHSGTSTPLTTLNTSDMADTVVDRDDITVTSGAVYRALDELRAEIDLLKGSLNE